MSTGQRTRERLGGLLLLATLALLPACASNGGPDPLRPINKPIHSFNNGVDDYVLAPVARGYRWVVPDMLRTGVSNFFDNISMPKVLLNDLLQGKWAASLDDLNRMLVNSTVGLAGLIDVASEIGLDENDEDFGQTLAVWGVPSGPYFVIPLLGPSTIRDTAALPVDYVARPWSWFMPFLANLGVAMGEAVSVRDEFAEEIDEAKSVSLDYYVFTRDAWLANRQRRILDGALAEDGASDDLYYLEEDVE